MIKGIEGLYKKYEEIRIMVDSALFYLEETNNYCNFEDLDILAKKVDDLGYKIEILETSDNPFKDWSKIRILKSYYFNLQYLHYLLAKKMINRCNFNVTLIIYFYGPEKICKKCKEQGYELTHLKKKYPKKVLIYSFDITYPNYFIYHYKIKYKIEKLPTLIIIKKGNVTVIRRYITWEELEKII